jgi:hypothetical protein
MLRIPEDDDLSTLIDWVELSCLFSKAKELSKAEVEDALADHLFDDFEGLAEDIWTNIEWRRQQCPNYPLRIHRHAISTMNNWNEPIIYAFQLLLSRHDVYAETRLQNSHFNELSRSFEQVTAIALEAYLPGKAYCIHQLRQKPNSLSFLDAVRFVGSEISEQYQPPPTSLEKKFAKQQDMGADVLVWRGFDDMRSGKAIIIAQCAAGRNWQRDRKGRDVALGLWNELLRWPSKPLLALAIPFIMREEDWYFESFSIGGNGGMIIDRLRLASLCAKYTVKSSLGQKLFKWCKAQIKCLPIET